MPPNVSVALLPCELPQNWATNNSLAVVIDTLRFTSTACIALANGAHSIRVLSHIDQAKQLAKQLALQSADSQPLLCGERNCVRIDGFHLGNSPAEYSASAVQGRPLVFSTTNGTVAVEAAASARQVLLGSLLNRAALVQWLTRWAATTNGDQADVWLICAGTDGQVALEDVITAGAILELLDWTLANDSAWLAFNSWQYIKQGHNLAKQMQLARGGANLVAAGFSDDIRAVLHVDSVSVVPEQTEKGRFEVLTLK